MRQPWLDALRSQQRTAPKSQAIFWRELNRSTTDDIPEPHQEAVSNWADIENGQGLSNTRESKNPTLLPPEPVHRPAGGLKTS